MANVKISALPTGTAPQGPEEIPAVQSGVTVSLTAAQLAALANGGQIATDSGAANAYVLTTAQPAPTPTNGQLVFFTPAHVNTGASTATYNGGAAKTIVGQTGAALTGGELSVSTILQWTGTQWQIVATGPTVPYARTAAEIAAGVTPTNYAYPPGNFRRYGAVGDGTTNDLTAVQNAFAVIVAAGDGAIYGYADDVYYLGTMSSSAGTILASVTGLQNCTVYGNGCTFKTNTNVAGTLFGNVFKFIDCDNVALYDCNFTDSGFDQSQKGLPNWQASHSVNVTVSGTTDHAGFSMFNCEASHTGSLFACIQGGGGRFSNINLRGCRTLNCTYGPNFQENGDDAIIDMYVLNPVRAYFPYGITNHVVDLHVRNDGGNANAGANALCELKRYQYDTRAIKLRVNFKGNSALWGCIVNLETQANNGTGPATMDSIDIDIRMSDSVYSSSCYPLQFRSYNYLGVQYDTTTLTPDTWSRITLRGDFGNWNTALVAQPVQIPSPPGTTRGQLAFPAGMFHPQTVYAQVFPGFAIQTAANKYMQSMKGDLTSTATGPNNGGATDARVIDLTKYNGTTFALKVKIHAVADVTLGSTSQTYAEYFLQGYVSSGTITLSTSVADISHTSGTASALSWSVSGTLLTLALTNYTGANASLRMEIEHLDKFC